MEFLSYAIKLAIDVGNNFPGNSSLAALDRFSSTKGHARVKQFHTFGSNCFVLGPKLCQNKYIPKWTPQSRQAIYRGILPQYAGSVALVLNLKTVYISTRFRIFFDDDFTTTTTTARITNTPRQLGRYFQKPSWTSIKGITVQHRKTMENRNWLFRGRPQGKQQLAYWPSRGIPQGKQQLAYWPFRGIPRDKKQLTFWTDIGSTF